jgi:radical SAM superfamily enzyme YgiQ (UPF0313 family)
MYHAIIFTGLDVGSRNYFRPLGAYRIRTELESKGYKVKVIDYFHNLKDEHIETALDKYVGKETLWVGFSTTFFNTSELLAKRSPFFERLRKKYSVPFVMGGAKSIVEYLDWADIFITGYADDATVAVTNYLADKGPTPVWRDYKGKKVIDSNHQYDKKDLSNIGVVWKPEDGIDSRQALPMEIARGCIFNCAFCNFPLNNKTKFDYVRVKDDMQNEFIRNYENFGTTSYWLMDDTYNDSMQKLELMHDIITSLPFKIKFDTYVKPELLVRWPDQIDLLVETGLRGASFGVESLNTRARQAIQKGANADKVLDAITSMKQKSNGQVKVQCNFIVGLPYEDEKSIWKTHETVINHDAIDWWNWYPLLIHSKDHHEYHSPIDRDPAKYGYEVASTPVLIKNTGAGKTNAWNTMWRNDYMNSMTAGKLAGKLRNMDQPLLKIGGWSCGSYESLGVDVDKHYETFDGMEKDLPIDSMLQNKKKIIDDYIQKEIV